jgi:hypothetical protein
MKCLPPGADETLKQREIAKNTNKLLRTLTNFPSKLKIIMFSKLVKITSSPSPCRRISLLNVWKIYWGKLSLKSVFSVGRERALEI